MDPPILYALPSDQATVYGHCLGQIHQWAQRHLWL
jgi:hypothetical protein